MFAKFDVFFMIRFLNSFGEVSKYPAVEVEEAVIQLLGYYGVPSAGNIYDDIFALDMSVPNYK
jgi:hypothetical protein